MVDIGKDFPKVTQALGERADDFLTDPGVQAYIGIHRDRGTSDESIDSTWARLYSGREDAAPVSVGSDPDKHTLSF